MVPLRNISTFRNFMDTLPWRNNPGGFEFASQRGVFHPAMIIKMVPVRDMSLPQQSMYTNFDAFVDDTTNKIKKGMHVKAVKINGQNEPTGQDFVSGMIEEVLVEHKHKRIRVFVRDVQTNQRVEVYLETIYLDNPAVEENQRYVKNFSEYQHINS
jgi:hypothetical protein